MKLIGKIMPALLAVIIMSCTVFGLNITARADSLANNTVSLTVGENIVTNYVIDCAAYKQHGGATLRYTYNGSTDKNYVLTTKTVDLSAQDESYAFSVYQAAAQIAEPTTVTVLTSDGTTLETFSYSAKEYCDTFINMTPEQISAYEKGERLQKVCKAVVAYGKAAQGLFADYMNNNEGAVPINETFDSLGITNDITYTPTTALTKTDSSNIAFKNISFICDSMARLRIYINPSSGFDISSVQPEVTLPDGAVFAPNYSAGRPYIDINNIKPYSFDERITIAYPDGALLSVSVLDYAKAVTESQAVTAEAKSLARTLINYNNTAKAYFHYNTHNLEPINPIAPTCTEAGNTAYYICSDCGDMFADAQGETAVTLNDVTLPALGHDYQAVVTAATCTAGGYTTHTCSRCGDNYTDNEVSALGHILGEPEFVWSQDYKSVTAIFHCGRTGCTDEITEYTTDIYSEETPATCTADGIVTYIGTFANESMPSATTTVVTQSALGHDYQAVVTAATCTAGGYTTHTCSRCGDNYTDNETAALGHSYTSVVTAPTCTAGGYATYTCSACGDTYTADETAALGHTAGSAVTENNIAATCTAAGSYDTVTYCTVCNTELSRETVPVSALGHNYSEWAITTAATCTAAGTESRTCSRCDAVETREIAAAGHDYQAVVTAATCTAGGYTTHTCSVCGDTYTDSQTAALGHNWGDWVVTTPATYNSTGIKTKTCSRCNATQTETVPVIEHVDNIDIKLEHTGDYLYRAGNSNNIAMSSLFKAADETKTIDSSGVSVTVTSIAGNAAGTYTKDSGNWLASTLKFTGLGVVKVTVKQYNNQAGENETAAELYLEIVNGTNKTGGALSNINSTNVVLLDNVTANKVVMSGNRVLYGNGFTVTDNRTDTSGAGNYYIQMSGGATIDNAILNGLVYTSTVTSGTDNQNYAPGVWIIGNANIYNSFVSETKNAVQIDSGDVVFENSMFSGGTLSNICINGGNVTLKDCITSSSIRNGLKGLGIRVTTANCKLNISGTLTQYNFLKKADLPSTYSSVLNSIYNDSTYAYTYGGNTYLNMGIFFVGESSITQSQAQTALNDNTSNNYGYTEKTTLNVTGTLYTMKTVSATSDLLTTPDYSPTVNGQHPIIPNCTFDYTTKNYIPKTAGDNNYCYYDTTTKTVQISFDKDNSSSSFSWDPMILTAAKNGSNLSYTVSMNNTDYTNGTIVFGETGDYQVVYNFTDPYNYSYDGTAFSKNYTKTVNIHVNAVEPDIQSYPCAFSYDGAAGNYSAKQVIGTDNKTYVMPDVSATGSTIGSTTVGGKTVYYPIVNVSPTGSNGNSSYSSGKGYYFSPVFSEIHIIDYNQDTGTKQYEYSKSTTTWPHGNSATTGPNTNYFTCASGEKTWGNTSPYARSTNSTYYRYGKNNLGVCYTTEEIEKDNSASNHLVQYHYVSNDGTTYYYYVYYKFAAMTYSSCVAEGTMVTMADGTQKAIEDVNRGDMVMTWSMWNGHYEAQPVAIKWYHGTDEWEVLTLHFSDGTEVRTINEHGFFDADLNTYAYIRKENVNDYIGDRFIKQQSDGSNTEVTLTGYELTTETVGSYSLQTAYNENFIVENMLSMTGEDYRGRFEYFEIGDGMKYDEAKMQADIARYGLYSYEDWSAYLTPEQFEMFNGAYFKILVGKGVFTEEDIYKIIGVNL